MGCPVASQGASQQQLKQVDCVQIELVGWLQRLDHGVQGMVAGGWCEVKRSVWKSMGAGMAVVGGLLVGGG